MPDLRPFRGLRYDPAAVDDWGAVLGPPYDVVDAAERAALTARSPYQINHIESASGEPAIARAAEQLEQWQRRGVLRRDERPSYYLHEHLFQHEERERIRLCLFVRARLTPWGTGEIRPHEWTMSGPREERASLRRATRADISPVFAIAPDRWGGLGALLADALRRPVVAAGVDAAGDHHRLRVINEPASIAALQAALEAEPVYIADGHHRYESALADREQRAAATEAWTGDEPENFVLMGIVRAADPGLVVSATHRLVHSGQRPPNLVATLRSRFQVEEVGGPSAGPGPLLRRMQEAGGRAPAIGALGLEESRCHLLIADERTRAALPARLPPSWRDLDMALLQGALLEPLLGVDDAALRGGEAMTYTHDAVAAFAAVRDGRAWCALLLNPPALEQVFASADCGDRMPQKSTYFLPKLPTGVVLYSFR